MNRKQFALVLTLLPALGVAQDKFTISGKLPNAGNDKKVMLSYVDSQGKNAKDSALLQKGVFSFSGTTAYGNRAYLSLLPVTPDTNRRHQVDYQEFYLSKGNYKVTGTDNMAKAVISGTQVQKENALYHAQMDSMLAQYRRITTVYMKAMSEKDSATMKSLSAEAKVLRPKMEATLDSFIYRHPDSYVSADLVHDNKTAVIDPVTFDPFYNALSARVKESFTGKKIVAKYEKAKQLFVGNTLNFTQQDTSGNAFTLASLKGKYVLVDFWASWCKPCRAENPNMVKAYTELKDKNFEIVGISLDETRNPWVKAIIKDGLPWIHVSDLKGWKNEVAVKYGISAVPQNVLIDPKGVIIAKDLRGEELTKKLQELIR